VTPLISRGSALPSLLWLFVCAYLVVAASSLYAVEIRPVARPEPGTVELCLLALLFAASWPLRAARWALRRLGRL
jgi:hypothetical protein